MKKHIKFIDIAKAFAIIIIVLGHTIVHSAHCHLLFKIIYSFNIPLFFILSGYTFNNNSNFLIFLKKKGKRILIPYFVWATIYIIPYVIYGTDIAKTINANSSYDITIQLLNILYGAGANSALKQNSALWFLPALFSMEMVFYFIIKYIKNDNKKKILFAIIILIINYLTSNYFKIILPFGINTVLNISLFFYYGYCLKNSNALSSKILKPVNILAFLLVGYLSCHFNHTISYIDYKYGEFILCLLSGLCFSNVIIIIAMQINKNNILEFIGINTMGVLLFHKIVILIFQTKLGIISKWLIESDIIRELILGIIVSVISIIVSIIINEIIKKKMPIIIGAK